MRRASAAQLGRAGVLLRIAWRNLLSARTRTAAIGSVIFGGTFLAVLGGALLDSVEAGMRRSIEGSVAGHVQVYDARSKDELALYGGAMGESDLEPIEDFPRLARTLLEVPYVRAVIPMATDEARIVVPTPLDEALADVRQRVRHAGDVEPSRRDAEFATRLERVRWLVDRVRADRAAARRLAGDAEASVEPGLEGDLVRATSDRFWRELPADPRPALEFLENRIAPAVVGDGDVSMRYVATDLRAFREAFDRMEVVEGAMVPDGERGVLLGRAYVEKYLKLRTARRLDEIREARDREGRRIATDERLRQLVRENVAQRRSLLQQLDAAGARAATQRLSDSLGARDADLERLLEMLLDCDDESFDASYRVFYAALAPLLRLYSVRIGDTITLQAPSGSGTLESARVKVYGWVQFKGLERSGLTGATSLLDLATWQGLHAPSRAGSSGELERLRARYAARPVERSRVEDELFGRAAAPVAAGRSGAIDAAAILAAARTAPERASADDAPGATGVALHGAVILRDPAAIAPAMRAIRDAARRAGWDLKVVTGQQASGLLGQFATLARVLLYAAVGIVFAVAVVVINNGMMMATLQRVKEIGTLRAIGASRRFVFGMLLTETAAIGATFGGAGAAAAAALLWWTRACGGLPARPEALTFFFSGPRLLPHVTAASLLAPLAMVCAVTLLSGLYPARLGTRVAPVDAMQVDE